MTVIVGSIILGSVPGFFGYHHHLSHRRQYIKYNIKYTGTMKIEALLHETLFTVNGRKS